MGRFTALSLALLASATIATSASAADNLNCVADGYTAEQQAAFARYTGDTAGGTVAPTPPETEAAITARVTACAAMHRWNDAAQLTATRYRRAQLLQERLRRSGVASEQSLTAMDRAIDASEPVQLRRTMEKLREFAAGRGPGPDNTDIAVIMPIFQASGLAMEGRSGEFIGAWLATRIAEQDLRAEFATQ
jgi:hypothetical protein